MDKEVLWTDLVAELQVGPRGLYWDLRDSHLRHWSLQVYRKDRASPLKLTFAYRVDKTWIPNPGNPITVAAVGDQDRLNVSVLEGLEERIISIDCKRHRFHMEPFLESVSSLPSEDKEEIERVMVSGVSKKAINFILETLGDINAREATEKEASRKQKKKQAETLLKSRTQDGGSSKKLKSMKGSQKPAEEDVEGTIEAPKKSKKVPSQIVPLSTPMDQTNVEKNTQETAGARKPQAAKRTLSPERKTKQKKLKSTDATEDTPLVLTATEKGRIITHGEEPSLEEAALDRKKFLQLFGHLYPFGVESVFHVNIKKMKSAKSYQVVLQYQVFVHLNYHVHFLYVFYKIDTHCVCECFYRLPVH